MSFWSKLFGKKDSNPDPLTASDWLHNMRDAFLQEGRITLQKNRSSVDMLVWFSLINATTVAANLLHKSPKAVGSIGKVLRELRIYFESLWQLSLLDQYTSPDDQEKIKTAYLHVQVRTQLLLEEIFQQNPRIEVAFAAFAGQGYARAVREAQSMYFQGVSEGLPKEIQRKIGIVRLTGNPLLSFATILEWRILSLDPSLQLSVEEILDSTGKALHLKFITQFDFPNCNLIQLPPDMIE